MRGRGAPNVGGLKPKFPDPPYHGVKDGLRSAVHQQQFVCSAFNKGDANDVRYSEMECVDQMNHSEQ